VCEADPTADTVGIDRTMAPTRATLAVPSDRGDGLAATDTTSALSEVAARAGERSAEIEALRRLPDDLVRDLVFAGAFRLAVPSVYGGAEVTAAELLDAIEAVAFHDGATGWCVMIANTTALGAYLLAEEHGRTIFEPPTAVTGGFAMPGGPAVLQPDGSLRVSGRWQWGSGTDHCTHIGGGVLVVDESGEPSALPDGSNVVFAFFDRADVTLLDTWHVSGLKGTASTDYEVSDAVVPAGRWVDLFAGRPPVVDGPLARLPFAGFLATGVAAVLLGLGRRAVAELVALGEKRPSQSSKGLAERAVVQAQLAEADGLVRGGRAYLHAELDGCWQAALAGQPVADNDKRRLRLAATTAARQAARAVDLCYEAGGGTSVYETSPLQRVFRDAHVATQHAMVAPRTLEVLGRMTFGLPTDTRTL
jgi:alkylation response protein AidB-like acyl-CoA dehydrogenase